MAHRHLPDRLQSCQNQEMNIDYVPQACGIYVALLLVPFVSPLRYLWLKKRILTRFGESSFSRLAPILPKPANNINFILQNRSISDTFPLAPFASPLWSLWLKKKNPHPYWQTVISPIGPNRVKSQKLISTTSIDQKHLWCFSLGALCISFEIFVVKKKNPHPVWRTILSPIGPNPAKSWKFPFRKIS